MAEFVLSGPPVAETGMLIRRPAAEVFEAFVDPAVTTQFWFTKGSGRLESGATVRWEWAMYGVGTDVSVTEFLSAERLVFEWDGAHGRTRVEWSFRAVEEGTFVEIRNSGFGGTADEQVAEAADSGQGFCWVLAGAKAWLEHGVQLNLVGDRFPRPVQG